MLSLSRLPANDNAFLPSLPTAEWMRGTNLYRPIAAPAAFQVAVRAELLRQPEVARKGDAHEIKRAIRAATTGLQWSWIGQWFQPDSEGRAIVAPCSTPSSKETAMPRPTDSELDDMEDILFKKMADARVRASTAEGNSDDLNRAAMVAHFAAALASLRSIPRGA